MAQTDSIDTNIILRIIVGDVLKQRIKAHEFLDSPNNLHFISDMCISEVVYVLEKVYQYDRYEVKKELTDFLKQYDNTINYNRRLINDTLDFWSLHPSLSFNDCYMAFFAEHNGVEPLFTLDKKLASQHPSAKLLN